MDSGNIPFNLGNWLARLLCYEMESQRARRLFVMIIVFGTMGTLMPEY